MSSSDITNVLFEMNKLSYDERPAYLTKLGIEGSAIGLSKLVAQQPLLPVDALMLDDYFHQLPEALHADVADVNHLARRIQNKMNGKLSLALGELHAAEFHDGPAFQFFISGSNRRLGDGGSYGEFGSAFLQRSVSVYSTVMGLERFTQSTRISALSAAFVWLRAASGADKNVNENEHLTAKVNDIVERLREARIPVWDAVSSNKMSSHLKEMARLNIPYGVLVGAEEITSGKYRLRGNDGQFFDFAEDDMVDWLITKFKASAKEDFKSE